MRHIQNISFVGSFPSAPPPTVFPEIAFVGRSNVGKSSAINTLLGRNRNKIARVSGQPGRTQGINIFEIDESFRFVDLPGYGFAKVPKSLAPKQRIIVLAVAFVLSHALHSVAIVVTLSFSVHFSSVNALETRYLFASNASRFSSSFEVTT